MGIIAWSNTYETGIAEIDNEHKMFLSIIQRIEEAIANNNKEHIIKLVEELLKYADFHFCSEENIMIREEYPDYQWHKRLHERLLVELRDKIIIMRAEYIDFPLLLNFLMTWFKNHTILEDKKIAAYIRSKQAK